MNRLFVLLFINYAYQRSHKSHYLSIVEMKDYNDMIDWRNFFDQQVKNDETTYNNIWNVTDGVGDDYKTAVCLIILILSRIRRW